MLDLIRNELNVENIRIVGEIEQESGWVIREQNDIIIGVDTRMTDKIKKDWIVREYNHALKQSIRKRLGVVFDEKILRSHNASPEIENLLRENDYFISGVTGSSYVAPTEMSEGEIVTEEIKVDNEIIQIKGKISKNKKH